MAASAPKTSKPKPAEGALLLWQRHSLLSRAQIFRAADLLSQLDSALAHKQSLRWGDLNRAQWVRLLRTVGVILLSRRQLTRQQHEPKRGARPAVVAYFGAPIQRHVELYILDVQTRLIRKPLPEQLAKPGPTD